MKLLRWLSRQIMRFVRWLFRCQPKPGEGISLLVPFKADNGRRQETWEWLEPYWRKNLPGAEIVIGTDDTVPFCKTAAVNDAALRATGDILVILDADAWVDPSVILEAVNQIREAHKKGERLWFIPYRRFWHVSDVVSQAIMHTPHITPGEFFGDNTSIPPATLIEEDPTVPEYTKGHWYAAMVQILPWEAWNRVGGMDPRFRGWGSEDAAFMYAVDTLWSKHKTLNVNVFHLWHPTRGDSSASKMWQGQEKPGTNNRMAGLYYHARNDRDRMQKLVD